MENKPKTVQKLFEAIKTTRNFDDLIDMQYVRDGYSEYVNLFFEGNNTERVNVTMDSEWAIIKDVIGYLSRY